MTATYFDDALPKFAALIDRQVGIEVLRSGLFLRDASGRLTFVVPSDRLPTGKRERLSVSAVKELGPYVDSDGFAVSAPEELFESGLLSEPTLTEQVRVGAADVAVRLIDRRVLGGDWLLDPTPLSAKKRLIFASLKGGVGRSTALCVAAAALADAGLRVLAIDMDVEAPGLGTMLLAPDALPRFGLLDYLVESAIGKPDDAFMLELTAPSWLAGGHGVISVVPAIGWSTFANKHNILSKIARAYLDDGTGHGGSVTRRMQRLLEYYDSRSEFDVVLVDARAGLHETTGSAILGLGGQVLLFGINQPQTFAAYELLMANLRLVDSADWSNRLLGVQAKATASNDQQSEFTEKFQEVLAGSPDNKIDTAVDLSAMRNVFNIEWKNESELTEESTESIVDDSNRDYTIARILENESFRDFDPLIQPENLSRSLYDAVYGDFLRAVFSRLDLTYQESLDG